MKTRVPGPYLIWIQMIRILVPGSSVDLTLAMQARFPELMRESGLLRTLDGVERPHRWLVCPVTGEILDPSYEGGLALGSYRATGERTRRPLDPPIPSLLSSVLP